MPPPLHILGGQGYEMDSLWKWTGLQNTLGAKRVSSSLPPPGAEMFRERGRFGRSLAGSPDGKLHLDFWAKT